MLLEQLKQEVADLGFETSVGDDNTFIGVVNRAIAELNAYLPETDVLHLSHYPETNTVTVDTSQCVRHTDEDLIFDGERSRAYYFECDGNGTAYIERVVNGIVIPVSQIALSSDGVFREYKGLIPLAVSGEHRIRFSGYAFGVRNVALYSLLRGASENDILPCGKFRGYDLRSIVDVAAGYSKFLAVKRSACKSLSQLTEGEHYYFMDNVLYLSRDVRGVIDIVYIAKPQPVTLSETGDLPVNSGLVELLPLFVASYLWLEDVPDKAQYYRELAESKANEYVKALAVATPVKIRRANGWS